MDGATIWAFYYIQGEDGEDRSHPNAFKIPVSSLAKPKEVTLGDVQRCFPLGPDVCHQFHFRFRLNASIANSASSASGASSNAASNPGASSSSASASASAAAAAAAVKNATFFWLDVTSPNQKVPLIGGRIICKLLRLNRPQQVGIVFKRKSLVQKTGRSVSNAGDLKNKAGSSLSSSSGAGVSSAAGVADLDRQRQSLDDQGDSSQGYNSAPFGRSSSSPAFEQGIPGGPGGRPAKYSDHPSTPTGTKSGSSFAEESSRRTGSGRTYSRERENSASSSNGGSHSASASRTGSGRSDKGSKQQPDAPAQDFLSGGQPPASNSSTSSVRKNHSSNDVNLMHDSDWHDTPAVPAKSATPNFMSDMDPLAPSNSSSQAAKNRQVPSGSSAPGNVATRSTPAAAAAPPAPPPRFEDDGGQTVGPVTMAEMEKYCTSTSDGSNVYNPNLVDKSTKPEFVRRAMEEREQKMRQDVEKAREELRKRDEAAKLLELQKSSVQQVLGPKLKNWAEDNGRIKNIRSLISTMHQVLWDDCKWQEVNMGKLIQPNEVKKFYRKAMIVVHPDKSPGRTAEQLFIAERVFAALNTAWDEFQKANP